MLKERVSPPNESRFESGAKDHTVAPFAEWPDGRRYAVFQDRSTGLDMATLPFHVNELDQIRTEYDTQGIDDLAAQVRTPDGVKPYFKLVQSVRIAEFTDQASLEAFLADFRLYYGGMVEVSADDLSPEPDGSIRILNYGHRRCRAVRAACEPHGYWPTRADVKTEIDTNPTFEEFIGAQYRENEHQRPSIVDEANNIRRLHEFYASKNGGDYLTQAELARRCGYNENKVRDALRFTELPPEVLAFYEYGLVNYSTAVEAWRLIDIYERYLHTMHPERFPKGSPALRREAVDSSLLVLNKLTEKHMQGLSHDQKQQMIKNTINSLQPGAMDQLFDDEESGAVAPRLRRARTKMVQTALGAIELNAPTLDEAGVAMALEAVAALAEKLQARRDMLEVLRLQAEAGAQSVQDGEGLC